MLNNDLCCILDVLPDNVVVIDREINGQLLEIHASKMYWQPRGFWKLYSEIEFYPYVNAHNHMFAYIFNIVQNRRMVTI